MAGADATETESTSGAADAARVLRRPARLGALLATVVFVLVLFAGHASLLQRAPTASRFFDAQAHSLLSGRWDVPQDTLEIEGFVVDGRTYEYFGPFPALIRLPVAAVTTSLDGRLGQLSMILAFVVAMAGTIRLLVQVRPLVRGAAPVTRGERWASGGLVFTVGAGSVLVFLASRSWAYHESELWGAALAIVAFSWILTYVTDPSRRALGLGATFTLLALLARGSVGVGPLAALGLVFVAKLFGWSRRLGGLPDERPRARPQAALAAAIAAPVAIYAYVNYSKFGTLFSLPFDAQRSSRLFRFNREVLAANHGSMFNLALLPTGLRQYVASRPLGPMALFPWIQFPPAPHTVGDVTIQWTPASGFPAAMPLLTVLAIVGLVAIIRPDRILRPSAAALRLPVIAAAVATVPTLAYAYVAQRYLSDFMPLAVLLAVAGLHRALRWSGATTRRSLRTVAATGVVVLGVLSLWFNVGLGVLYGRVLDDSISRHDRTAFVSFQYALAEHLPGGPAPRLERGTRLPAAQPNTLFAFPDCAALYWSDGESWSLLESGPASGHERLTVRFPEGPTGWQPFVVARPRTHRGHRAKAKFMATRVLPDGRVQFAFDGVIPADPVRVTPGVDHRVEVVMTRPDTDREGAEVRVRVDGRTAYETSLPNPIIGERLPVENRYTVGEGDLPGVEPRFTGTIRRHPASAPLCRRLTRR